MAASHHFTHVDTLKLKDHIYQQIGHKRARKYFDDLNKFLNLKLNKIEFDKSCIQTIGRENISLHNQLLRSILQNAQNAKSSPQNPCKNDGLGNRVTNGYQKNYSQSHVNRKFRADRLSPLGPLGKSTSITYEETGTRINESPNNFLEDGEEVEQFSRSFHVPRWSQVTTPFGVSVNLGGEKKASGIKYSDLEGFCQISGELPDTGSLRNRLQKKLAIEGLWIPKDCCNLLNNGLNVYLKRLIEPCIGIAGSRYKVGRHDNQMVRERYAKRSFEPKFVSMLDFQVAMESNPRLLGENWPTQFEKMYHRAY